MAVATETVTTNAGSGGDTTTVVVEGSLTKRPGGDAPPLSWRQLHDDGDSGDDDGGGDYDCGSDNDGDSGR